MEPNFADGDEIMTDKELEAAIKEKIQELEKQHYDEWSEIVCKAELAARNKQWSSAKFFLLEAVVCTGAFERVSYESF